jgi:hypothetical protein
VAPRGARAAERRDADYRGANCDCARYIETDINRDFFASDAELAAPDEQEIFKLSERGRQLCEPSRGTTRRPFTEIQGLRSVFRAHEHPS